MNISPQLELLGRRDDGAPVYAYFLGDDDPVPTMLARIAELETAAEAAEARHAAEIATLQADLSAAHGERIAFEADLAKADVYIMTLKTDLAIALAVIENELTASAPHDLDDYDGEACTADCPTCTAAEQEARR